MDKAPKVKGVRQLYRLACSPTKPQRGEEAVRLPGPLFDFTVVGLTVIAAIGFFVSR